MKDIFKEMEQLRTRLDELSAYAEKECKKPKMFPQEDDTYWYYYTDGTVCHRPAADSRGRLNVYKTEQEAVKARDIQWAKQRVAHSIEVLNNGWKPDWSNSHSNKFIICLTKGLSIDYYWGVKIQPTWMYMISKEVAEKILAEHETDLLLILGE